MNDKARRKDLQAQYKDSRPEAGVYRIINTQTNRALLGATPNLASIRNKLAFARSTNSGNVLDHRLAKDIRQFGIGAFSLEVLEVLETKPGMTQAVILEELAMLESLYREQSDPAMLY